MPELRTRQDLALAVEANHCAFFGRFGRPPGGETLTRLGVTRYSSGVDYPMFNGAFSTSLDPGTTPQAIEDVRGYFAHLRLPFIWWSLPSRDSSELGTELVAQGLARERDAPGMALDLRRPGTPPPAPAGLEVTTLADPPDLSTYGRTLNAGDFQAPEDVARHIPRILTPDPGDSRFRFFLGWIEGRPVATSLLFTEAGVAGIYGVATIPEERHKGVGAALTWAAVEAGRRAGFSHAVLVATTMGAPVYLRLGFEEVCRFGSYVGDPSHDR